MRCFAAGIRGGRNVQTLALAAAIAARSFSLVLSFAQVPPDTISPLSRSKRLLALMKNVVAAEEAASVTPVGSKDFLLSNPSGAYTTARTCGGGTRIFEWEAHVRRTASSLGVMLEQETAQRRTEFNNHEVKPATPSVCRLSDPSVLRPRLDASVGAAVHLYRQVNNITEGDVNEELKITALVGWKKNDTPSSETHKSDAEREGWVACHVTNLPPLPTPPVRVEVRGCPRENAAAKDSAWVADRAPLEDLLSRAEVAPMNELLLTDPETQEILEGSQTNFYAVVDGAVHTAEEGILAGTVRGLVLDVCRKEGIPVVLKPPSLAGHRSWQGAIVSSTSRLALPIDEFYIPTVGCPSKRDDLKMTFQNGPDSVAAKIQKLVSMEVEARSTPIIR